MWDYSGIHKVLEAGLQFTYNIENFDYKGLTMSKWFFELMGFYWDRNMDTVFITWDLQCHLHKVSGSWITAE